MSRPPKFHVSDAAIDQARNCGVIGNVAKRVSRMARRAAPFTGATTNRRFDDYAMQVNDGLVTIVSLVSLEA